MDHAATAIAIITARQIARQMGSPVWRAASRAQLAAAVAEESRFRRAKGNTMSIERALGLVILCVLAVFLIERLL